MPTTATVKWELVVSVYKLYKYTYRRIGLLGACA